MRDIIFLIWVVLFIVISIFLVGVAYYKFIRASEKTEVVLRAVMAFVTHFIVSMLIGLPLFIVNFLYAHATAHPTKEVVRFNDFSRQEITFWLSCNIIYLLIGWLLISFVAGRFIKPWKLLSFSSGKAPSILTRD